MNSSEREAISADAGRASLAIKHLVDTWFTCDSVISADLLNAMQNDKKLNDTIKMGLASLINHTGCEYLKSVHIGYAVGKLENK